MSVTEEFLDKIRAIDGMKNAIVSNIEIYGRRKIVCFYLVTDLPYSQNVIPQAEQIAASFLPQGFSAAVKIEKKTPACGGRTGVIHGGQHTRRSGEAFAFHLLRLVFRRRARD